MTRQFHVPAGTAGRHHPVYTTVCYSVQADSDPGLLSRVIEPVAKRGKNVDKLNAILEPGPDPVLLIDFQVSGLDRQDSDIIGAVLGQIVGVRQVLVCDKA